MPVSNPDLKKHWLLKFFNKEISQCCIVLSVLVCIWTQLIWSQIFSGRQAGSQCSTGSPVVCCAANKPPRSRFCYMPSEPSQGTALFWLAPVAKFKSVMSAVQNVRGTKQRTTSCVEVLSGVTTTFLAAVHGVVLHDAVCLWFSEYCRFM